jgi:putative membrane protein
MAASLLLLTPLVAVAQTTTRDRDTTTPARDVRVERDARVDRDGRVVERDGRAVDRDGRVVDARPLKRTDRAFFEKAAKASMAEIQISRVAASRTSNPEVRRLAQMMVEDHERALEELTALAAARGVSLPAKEPHPDKWEKRDAKNFDRDYLDKLVDDHNDVVRMFEKHAKDGEDADTVAFARKHLPKMQHHLQQSLDLKRVLK